MSAVLNTKRTESPKPKKRLRSPSQIGAQAAGVDPLGSRAEVAGVCAMCGYPHEPGDPILPFVPSDSFTDFGSMMGKGSTVACGWCMATWNADFTQKYTKSIMCDQGVFPAASNDHLAHWLTNPPEGEWVFLQADQKRQHLIWRTPVNHSKELFVVRFGELLLTVRPAHLIAATDAARRVAAALSAGEKGAKTKTPFVSLSRDVDSPSQGVIKHKAHELAKTNQQVADDISLLNTLTPGELWGLTATLYAASPNRPEPKLVPK